MIDVSNLSYRYGKHTAIDDLTMHVPSGVLYALLGPNGSGKTTLLQILMGLRKGFEGTVRVGGKDVGSLTVMDRASISYIAEGQALPSWMRLEQLEAYLRPLYPGWDAALATELREQFALDPKRKIGSFSRGEQMKVALLCALAPRPRLLIMDEPFTGMDALVKDELVRGLLQSSGSEGWTVLLCSHDIGELELLADHIGLMQQGRLRFAASVDEMHQRMHRVDAMLPSAERLTPRAEWLAYEQNAHHVAYTVDWGHGAVEETMRSQLPEGTRVDIREATLREVFIAFAQQKMSPRSGVAA